MNRERALFYLKKLIGHDLRPMADYFSVTVWKDGKKHKGWAGNALEVYLGLPPNNSFMADFYDWDLKSVLLTKRANGDLRVKETMAIDMITPAEVLADEFENSHLYDKFRRLLVVARIWQSVEDDHSVVHSVVPFDVDDPEIFPQVKADYEAIRAQLRAGGLESLSGEMGVLVQPRTKGAGNGSTSKAFYARTQLVARMLKLEE